jgi:hypothetical protein
LDKAAAHHLRKGSRPPLAALNAHKLAAGK